MTKLKSNERNARLAILFLGLKPLFCLIAIGFAYPRLRHFLRMAGDEGGFFSLGAALPDPGPTVYSLIHAVFNLLLVFFFLRWFYRACRNLETRSGRSLTHSPEGALVAWFVPILNLFCPYKTMKELFAETGKHFGSAPRSGWLRGWWALWVVCAVSGTLLFLGDRFETFRVLYGAIAGFVTEALGIRIDSGHYLYGGMIGSLIVGMFFALVQIAFVLLTVKVICDYRRIGRPIKAR